MIVYNVKLSWFTDKSAADMYRKVCKLKPASLVTVRVEGRDDLAKLLNALCQPSIARVEPFQPAGNAGSAPLPRIYGDVEIPDFIPAFLLKDGKRRV